MKNQQLSKYLSLLLRHRPEIAGLKVDAQGWTPVEDLLRHLQEKDPTIDRSRLQEVVDNNPKNRFFLDEDSNLIRAQQGHSIPVDLGYAPAEAPECLFHGTAHRFLSSILEKGLVKGQRHHVHLSKDLETAAKVGQRHGKLVILAVDTRSMMEAGFEFFLTPNQVWLTDYVPNQYLKILEHGI